MLQVYICFDIIGFFLAAEPQLMLTAGPGMIGPGYTPGYPNAYAPGMPYQGYSMQVCLNLCSFGTTLRYKKRKTVDLQIGFSLKWQPV